MKLAQPNPSRKSVYKNSAEIPVTVKRRLFWLEVEAIVERAFILFCLYTLSIGPMYWHWLASVNSGGPMFLAVFYAPLRILGQLIPLFGEWLNWYVCLWIL